MRKSPDGEEEAISLEFTATVTAIRALCVQRGKTDEVKMD